MNRLRIVALITAVSFAVSGATCTCPAGEIANQRATLLNNDDHTSGNNPNLAMFLSITGNPQVDRIIAVLSTGGTTEYDYRLNEPNAATGVPEWRVELGFGTGDNFVSAATILPELDFDAPTPSRAPTAGTYQLVQPFAHAINFSNGDYGAFSLSLDIPDLPTSVLDFYTPAQIASLPPGTTAFTLRSARGLAVPEPATVTLLAIGFGVSFFLARARLTAKRTNG